MERLSKNKKGYVGLLIGLFLVGLAITAAAIFGPRLLAGKGLTGDGVEDWSGRNVKYEVHTSRMLTGAALNPAISLYKSEPTDWLNARGDQGTADSTYTSTNGTATIEEVPGKYWLKNVLSSYYTEFLTVEVPKNSGKDSLSDYNQAPEIEKIQMLYVETMNVTNIDMGLSTNTTDKETTEWGHFDTTENQGLKLWKVKFKMGAEDFNEDTDGDGIYDEGIKIVEVEVEGNKKVLFDSSKSIDLFGADNEYNYDLESLGLVFKDGTDVLDLKIYIKANTWHNGTGSILADDEKFGDGENPLDFIIVDTMGNALGTGNVFG